MKHLIRMNLYLMNLLWDEWVSRVYCITVYLEAHNVYCIWKKKLLAWEIVEIGMKIACFSRQDNTSDITQAFTSPKCVYQKESWFSIIDIYYDSRLLLCAYLELYLFHYLLFCTFEASIWYCLTSYSSTSRDNHVIRDSLLLW